MSADEGNAIKVRVDFVDRGGYAESLTSDASGTMGGGAPGSGDGGSSQNSPANGAPSISRTALVGQTLTADTSGIADSDGLTVVSYSYQWISYDSSSDSNPADATGSKCTLVAANTGKSIKLRVTFTDDAGNAESLTSAATAVIRAPLTGDFTRVPGSHDGETASILELTFNKSPDLSFRTLRFHAFTVEGGAVRQGNSSSKAATSAGRSP